MDTDFGILPYILIITFALLVVHASSERPWCSLSKTGLITFIACFALSAGYGADAVNSEMSLFIPVAASFVIFVVCAVLVMLKEAATLLHGSITKVHGK